jgi:antitoxin component YwqK of YwqJK toxin-antitoxin module
LNLNGQFTSYYPKGFYEEANTNDQKQLIYASGAYKDGFKEGVWKYYLCDGTIQYQGKYFKGNKVGNWTNFDLCNSAFYFKNPTHHEH